MILSWVNSSDLFPSPLTGEGRVRVRSKIVPPSLSSPEVGEEG